MPDARYTNRYTNARTCEDNEIYELVQLLRVNGADIRRVGTHAFTLRMGRAGTWKKNLITSLELKARFGHGTVEYDVLRSHQCASSVPVAKPYNTKHMDLV